MKRLVTKKKEAEIGNTANFFMMGKIFLKFSIFIFGYYKF